MYKMSVDIRYNFKIFSQSLHCPKFSILLQRHRWLSSLLELCHDSQQSSWNSVTFFAMFLQSVAKKPGALNNDSKLCILCCSRSRRRSTTIVFAAELLPLGNVKGCESLHASYFQLQNLCRSRMKT